MTEHSEKPTTEAASKEAGAPGTEIEITPEMIEAGVEKLLCQGVIGDEGPSDEEIKAAVIETYKAMVLAYRGACS